MLFCLRLRWIIWGILFAFLLQMSPTRPSSSSLRVHANSQIRQARTLANAPPYRSPQRCSPDKDAGARPLRPVLGTRPNGDPESHRAANRSDDRERQLALQETPSRRRRRIPGQQDENRAPSPTPNPRRPLAQPNFAGVGTPPDSQQPSQFPNRRAAGQQARHQQAQPTGRGQQSAPYATGLAATTTTAKPPSSSPASATRARTAGAGGRSKQRWSRAAASAG
ncbi:hypothetical protein R3P38DRAFT_2765320 [Favolaschia claudopus]|uniref:Uncharacterized protein n=1 Tax=Favolaschia claudopus TaxID=2862362 RepID=A0AAW0D622_9AGAR